MIGVFAPAIQNLVALATLMPIVASMGGTGNQTVALVIRGLALDQFPRGSTRHVLRKELTVGAVNGVVWGGVMGLCALALYGNLALSGVMSLATFLNLIVASSFLASRRRSWSESRRARRAQAESAGMADTADRPRARRVRPRGDGDWGTVRVRGRVVIGSTFLNPATAL